MMNPWVIGAASLALIAAGAVAGVGTYKVTVVAACAADIAKTETGSCPKIIQTAFDAAKLKSVEKQVEYRDGAIRVIAVDAQEDQARAAETQALVAALNAQERTNACASSPAFVSRRQQLCAAVGGPDCEPTDQAAR